MTGAHRGVDVGEDETPGENRVSGEAVPAKTTRDVPAGTLIIVRTSGGGHGDPDERDPKLAERDHENGVAE